MSSFLVSTRTLLYGHHVTTRGKGVNSLLGVCIICLYYFEECYSNSRKADDVPIIETICDEVEKIVSSVILELSLNILCFRRATDTELKDCYIHAKIFLHYFLVVFFKSADSSNSLIFFSLNQGVANNRLLLTDNNASYFLLILSN